MIVGVVLFAACVEVFHRSHTLNMAWQVDGSSERIRADWYYKALFVIAIFGPGDAGFLFVLDSLEFSVFVQAGHGLRKTYDEE